jgi:hypothetical protein
MECERKESETAGEKLGPHRTTRDRSWRRPDQQAKQPSPPMSFHEAKVLRYVRWDDVRIEEELREGYLQEDRRRRDDSDRVPLHGHARTHPTEPRTVPARFDHHTTSSIATSNAALPKKPA